ncbi:hypothetical protein NRIC_17640 [Enterococcus florum]|uniref:Gram-positive cocci surface proteins LPxTG domain-containing protein n=1 Tax=Enterococcus florum TaxID=2480627 RepID=A0A4P5PKK7_9ENTE|nr:LPXTG cell wall anchor domain-containing protein [Enterococcus florum]GCF93873.1 hypothetical protein NRIC_17640 [Enterococcus florum]
MERLKRMLVVLLVLILSAIPFQKASAAETNLPDGFLVGDESGINVSKDGGYFFNLDDLQPGDTVKRNLIIKNTLDEDYQLKLAIEPKSKSGKVDLIENMSMQILLEDQEVYQGNLSNDKSGSKEVSFGTIPAKSEIQAVINLRVNEIENWNQVYFSGPSEAEVDWIFTAVHTEKKKDELPKTSGESPGSPASPSSPSGSNSGKVLPRTGERINNGLFALGILLVAAVCFMKMKQKRSE